MLQLSLKQLREKYCNCNTEKCCCTTLVEKFFAGRPDGRLYDSSETLPTADFPASDFHMTSGMKSNGMKSNNASDNFFTKYDSKDKSSRFFCHICTQYGKKERDSEKAEDNWTSKGKALPTDAFRRNFAMKRHLHSVQHKRSLEAQKAIQDTCDVSVDQRKKATENLLIGAQLMASCNMPYRTWPLFCATLHLMSSNSKGTKQSSLVGNNNQSHNVVPKAQYACYEACCEQMQKEFAVTLRATNQIMRYNFRLTRERQQRIAADRLSSQSISK